MSGERVLCVRFSPDTKVKSYFTGGMRFVRRDDVKWFEVPEEIGERLRFVVDNAARMSPRTPMFDVFTPEESERIDAYEDEQRKSARVEQKSMQRRRVRTTAPPTPRRGHPALSAGKHPAAAAAGNPNASGRVVFAPAAAPAAVSEAFDDAFDDDAEETAAPLAPPKPATKRPPKKSQPTK